MTRRRHTLAPLPAEVHVVRGDIGLAYAVVFRVSACAMGSATSHTLPGPRWAPGGSGRM